MFFTRYFFVTFLSAYPRSNFPFFINVTLSPLFTTPSFSDTCIYERLVQLVKARSPIEVTFLQSIISGIFIF